MKDNHLKQARTNTIYNIFEKKLYCQIQNVWENFSVKIIEIKKFQVGQKFKKLENDVLEIALDQ